MFFLPPVTLGDLSKEFGNCFRFIFSLWCHRFLLPFPVFRALTPLQERLTNFAIKREQSQACLSYAEREQNRRSQKRRATSESTEYR